MKLSPLPVVLAVAATTALATQTRRFVTDTAQALEGAEAVSVAVAADGSLRPLPPLEPLAQFDEPLGLALALDAGGVAWVGTGHPARVWRIAANGDKELAAEIEADQVTSLLLAPDGALYVTTAAPASLVRIDRSHLEPELVSALPEGNLWDVAWFDGALVAAAGNPGRLLRLGRKGLELAATIPDQHARCLVVSGDSLLIGTSGRGLILRWNGSGPVGAFFDAGFTEVADLVVGPDGTVYAAALTGDPTLGKPVQSGKDEASVTVSTGGEAPPQANGGTATSEILRIVPAGAATTLHRFTKQLAATLTWGAEGLVVGTGIEGEIWQLSDGAAAELDTVDAAQVTALAAGGDLALVQGPVRLLQRRGEPRGTLVSPVLDAGQPSRWGAAEVESSGSGCSIRFRSGATEEPDETWSSWGDPHPCGVLTAQAPPSRYLQWKLELAGRRGAAATVHRVEVAYRQVNLPPEISELTVHEPGEVFLKTPPPADRIVDVEHPGINGIFTTLSDDAVEQQGRLGKKYYRIGYQSVSWKAEDPNGEPMLFSVEVRGRNEERWLTIRKDLGQMPLAFDTLALADGRYRLRLTASDEPANPDDSQTTSRLSSWFTVDNTPPAISFEKDGSEWLVTVEDGLSPLTTVEWNRDADGWHAAEPVDGLLDSRRERFRIPAAAGRHLLSVRAVDDHHNRATAAREEKP